jgi:hypothetical protein
MTWQAFFGVISEAQATLPQLGLTNEVRGSGSPQLAPSSARDRLQAQIARI